MKWSRIYSIYIRQLYLLTQNPTRLANLMWVAIDIMLWGFITKYLDTLSLESFSLTSVLFAAVILWGILTRMQQGVMVAFFEDIWSQNFINFFASPLKISEYISGLVITGITTAFFGFLLIIIISALFFGYNIFQLGIMLLPFLLILFVFGIGLGIFASGVVLRFGPSAEWIAWPLLGILSPLAGVFYPVSILPATLQVVARCLPASYVFESMRSIIINNAYGIDLYYSLLIGFVLALVYLFGSYLFFVYMYRYVLRRGLITRFSAESSN